jgi:hypothetical protein
MFHGDGVRSSLPGVNTHSHFQAFILISPSVLLRQSFSSLYIYLIDSPTAKTRNTLFSRPSRNSISEDSACSRHVQSCFSWLSNGAEQNIFGIVRQSLDFSADRQEYLLSLQYGNTGAGTRPWSLIQCCGKKRCGHLASSALSFLVA